MLQPIGGKYEAKDSRADREMPDAANEFGGLI
jgi:hypothetical protein